MRTFFLAYFNFGVKHMTARTRYTAIAAGLIAMTGFAMTAQSARPVPFGNPLRISIQADAGDSGNVQFRITNTSKQAIKVPAWQLPSAQLNSDLFEVYQNGKKVDYVGAMIKRAPLTETDFITLRAGETKLIKADLSSVYDMTQDGQYSVNFKSYLQGAKSEKGQLLSAANGQIALLKTPSMRTFVAAASPTISDMQNEMNLLEQKVGGAKPTAVTNGVNYTGCTASRTTTAGQAVNAARNYAQNALNYLNAGTVGARYTTWFGSYTSTRYNAAKSRFQKIDTALDQNSGQITINCGCNQNYYAYVYPNQPYQIYVCKAFWSAGLTGTDSKGGTLVHEMSHFDIVGNTDDVVYGQSGAKSLAISNPADAGRNADTHEYFSENTPFQN
jgi:peptidyl-Lys metalloendopeptidase